MLLSIGDLELDSKTINVLYSYNPNPKYTFLALCLSNPNPNSPCATTWIRVGPSSRALPFIIINPLPYCLESVLWVD